MSNSSFKLNQDKFIKYASHSVIASKYQSARVADAKKRFEATGKAAFTPTSKINSFGNFLEKKVFKWVSHAVRHLFISKENFRTYTGIAGDNGIYKTVSKEGKESNTVNIAITADWATNTQESADVAIKMMSHQTDYTVHLGDTYYTGEKDEIESNFTVDGAPWKRGPSGTFALMGNHEMYSAGKFYYEPLLPSMGIRDFANTTQVRYQGQQASYFCLRTDFWDVIGLDTGYNSVGFPFLSPPRLVKDCRLEPGLINWLKDEVKLKDSGRGIIFLSHHQYCSAYEQEFFKPAEQLAELIGKERKVLWIWGHEHRLSIYGQFKSDNGIGVYGRCIGHGGIPVETDRIFKKEKDSKFDSLASSRKLVITDKRLNRIVDKTPVGFNGYALISLENELATVAYYSLREDSASDPLCLLQETWEVQRNESGAYIQGLAIQQFVETPDFKVMKDRKLADAYL